MNQYLITEKRMEAFQQYLEWEEKSPGTIEKYLRDVKALAAWLGDREVSKEAVGAWKAALMMERLTPGTINTKLAAVNKFLAFLGWREFQVKPLRIQRRLFRDDQRGCWRQPVAWGASGWDY